MKDLEVRLQETETVLAEIRAKSGELKKELRKLKDQIDENEGKTDFLAQYIEVGVLEEEEENDEL